MKKRKCISIFCVMLCILMAFGGCGAFGGKTESSSLLNPPPTVEPTPTPEASPAAESSVVENAPESAPKEPVTPTDFAINHYALSPDATDYVGTYMDEYKLFIDAILGYSANFTFSDKSAKKAILGVVNQFPLISLCNTLDVDFETPETPLTYKCSQDDFTQKVAAFDAEITRIVTENTTAGHTEFERTIYLYQAVASYSYDNSLSSDTYTFFTAKKGSSFGFAGALCYLLNQTESKATLATGTTVAGKDHQWVLFGLNEHWYNMDPAFENGATGGKGLSYFIMSDQLRAENDCVVPYSAGENGYFQQGVSKCDDTQFDQIFTDTGTWKLDEAEHILYLAKNDSDGFTSSMRTDEFTAIY